MSPDELVGAWTLERFRIRFDDGRDDLFPFGPDATGLLMYSASGRMSAVLSRAERDTIEASRLETASRAPEADKARAFDSYLSYAGTWSIDGDDVVHTVTHALSPNLVGQDNRRRARLNADVLTLGYRLVARSGVARDYELTWRRA